MTAMVLFKIVLGYFFIFVFVGIMVAVSLWIAWNILKIPRRLAKKLIGCIKSRSIS